MNSVSKSLLSGVAFASSALQVWNDLKERFDRFDGSRTYSLHKDIVTMQQGTNSISEYYTIPKTLWDESELLVPAPCCNCDKSKGFVAHMNRQKLYQFLMGLNESFQQARSQILMLNPLPTINHAYAMIIYI
uniref:Putative ovule protein n=1 Tax=Solanum chacoense TaxID=4108 RepID=A0A0V0H604_SOLCH